jgi:hypothetical protein
MHPLQPLLADTFDPARDIPDSTQRHCFVPYEQRWDGEGPIPKTGGGVPSLRDIHPRRWEEVMIPLNADRRLRTAYGQGLAQIELMAATALLEILPPPAQEIAREAARAHFDAPVPRPRRPDSRQVNIRLRDAEYEELQTAAAIAGTTPTTLARWFLSSGSRQVIADHAEVYSRTRG